MLTCKHCSLATKIWTQVVNPVFLHDYGLTQSGRKTYAKPDNFRTAVTVFEVHSNISLAILLDVLYGLRRMSLVKHLNKIIHFSVIIYYLSIYSTFSH